MGQAGETACPTMAGTRFRKVAQAVPPAFRYFFTASHGRGSEGGSGLLKSWIQDELTLGPKRKETLLATDEHR